MSRMVLQRFTARKAITATAVAAALTTSALTAAPLTAAAQNVPEAARTCALKILPIPTGLPSTKVTGMSRDGSVIAYQADPPNTGDPDAPVVRYPFLYAGGKVTKVPMAGEWQEITDVNSKGVGVGHAEVNGTWRPYVWRDGKLTRLLGGRGFAHGINEKGDIVGRLQGPLDDPNNSETGATVWWAGTTNPVRLPLPKTVGHGTATAIANDGRIVGHVTVNGLSKPYIWYPNGTGKYLPMPAGVKFADALSEPMEINGDWVSGILRAPGIAAPGIRWNLAKGTAEMTKLGRDYENVGIGPDGTTVGVLYNTPTAAYQTGGTVFKLPGVVDPAASINWDNAEAISADGSLIAGTAWAGNNTWNAVTWTCK